jgi:hypothetical protein
MKIDLHDVSPKACPVRVSGVVSVVDDTSNSIRSYQVNGHFHNVSNKDIALIVVHLSSDERNWPSLNLTYKEDYFFRNLLEKNSSVSFDPSEVKLKLVPNDPVPDDQMERSSVLAASAEMVFVQFADGTTWGDSQAERDALTQRKQIAQELSRLERVLGDAGEQALVNEFSSKSDQLPACVRSLLDRCSVGSPSCLADDLRSVLATARQHEINMKSASTKATDPIAQH